MADTEYIYGTEYLFDSSMPTSLERRVGRFAKDAVFCPIKQLYVNTMFSDAVSNLEYLTIVTNNEGAIEYVYQTWDSVTVTSSMPNNWLLRIMTATTIDVQD